MSIYIIYTMIFLYGIVIGSFLNVCIYRIPEKSSIVFGRSHCMNCYQPIPWYDLIPILSFIILRGKCRRCKDKISIQYPIIEAINGILYMIVFFTCGWENIYEILISSMNCLIISALIVLSIIDLRTKTIPYGINIFIFIVGAIQIAVRYFQSGCNTDIVIEHLLGFFAVSILLILIFYLSHKRGIGGGDIKLMAAAGLVLGWKLVILAFFFGCIFGSIIHPLRMIISHRSRVLAFGPYLSAGILIAILYGNQIIDWYMRTFFH